MKAKLSRWRLLVVSIVMLAALPLILQGCGSSTSTSTDTDSGTERTVTLTGATS